MIRETYYSALFAVLQTLQGSAFSLVSRKLLLIGNMNSTDFPALFMVVHNQVTAAGPIGLPGKRTLGAQLFIYVSNPDATVSADPLLNTLIDVVEAALAPSPMSGTQTLGGIAQHCWIDGVTEVFSGSNSQSAAAIIPVKILVP